MKVPKLRDFLQCYKDHNLVAIIIFSCSNVVRRHLGQFDKIS